MTDHPDPVETLAQALWDAYTRSMHDFAAEAVAETLLAQITPALVAEAVAKEREACAAVCGTFDGPVSRSQFVNGQVTAAQQIRAAIRARTP